MRRLPLWKPILIGITAFFSLLYSFPSLMGGVPGWWPSWLPNQVIARGLDLQGGLYLLLRVETEKAVEQTTENLVDEVRGILRREKVRYRGVTRDGMDAVLVRASAESSLAELRDLLVREFPNLAVESGESGQVRLRVQPPEVAETRRSAIEQTIQTLRSRIDQFGVSEPTIQRQGEERILIQLPGLKDPARAKALIGRTARLEFKMVDRKSDLAAAQAGRIPAGRMLLYEEDVDPTTGQKRRIPWLVKKRTVISGDMLTDARVSYSNMNESYVAVRFNRQGARKFSQLTGENVGELMAIVLDGKVYSAPVIRSKIDGGRASIEGGFTTETAHDLAIVLRAGALPAPVTIMEERTVGPTLGSDSIQQGLTSIMIGGVLVLLFMALYYKGFGLLANLAVVLNVLILMGVLAAMQATLTLPGLAGAVLLIGMAVDANVLIFERIREELKLGKTPLAAIEHGYDKAFSTILDANITTLITAVVLFQFGTGPVKGFAVTLSIGLLASMFTAIFMTRVLLAMFMRNRRITQLSI
jgi:preprotein translocase subunit SecD